MGNVDSYNPPLLPSQFYSPSPLFHSFHPYILIQLIISFLLFLPLLYPSLIFAPLHHIFPQFVSIPLFILTRYCRITSLYSFSLLFTPSLHRIINSLLPPLRLIAYTSTSYYNYKVNTTYLDKYARSPLSSLTPKGRYPRSNRAQATHRKLGIPLITNIE